MLGRLLVFGLICWWMVVGARAEGGFIITVQGGFLLNYRHRMAGGVHADHQTQICSRQRVLHTTCSFLVVMAEAKDIPRAEYRIMLEMEYDSAKSSTESCR